MPLDYVLKLTPHSQGLSASGGGGGFAAGVPAVSAGIDLSMYTALPATSVFSANGTLKREYSGVIKVSP